MTLELLKYQGLGNDFLILVDEERRVDFDASLARALCDRHLGLGADGVMRLSAPRGSGDVSMELRNADGSVAETSGNGLRCAALAAVHEALVPGPELTIETLSGASRAAVAPDIEPGKAQVRVDMGVASVGAREPLAPFGPELGPEIDAELAAFGVSAARRVDIGNPHLVLIGAAAPGRVAAPLAAVERFTAGQLAATPRPRVDIGRIGPALEARVPGGINVEVVVAVDGALLLEVWERGAGLTRACGSGSCAAAAACRAEGVAGDVVDVANPGGVLRVELSGPVTSPRAWLTGPAQRVARMALDAAGARVAVSFAAPVRT